MISMKENIVRENWIKAASEIGFEILSPYKINIENRILEVFAFLPKYGSNNGMIVELTSEPLFIINQDIVSYSKRNKCFYSFINIDIFLEYNKSEFIDLLDDWGCFGNNNV
jgi:hypothetical protein